MLLRALRDYALKRTDIPPRLYGEVTARYVVTLAGDGRARLRQPYDRLDPKTKRVPRMRLPSIQRTSGVRANLLNGNAEYTFGLGRETSRPARVLECHEAYLDLLRRCAVATQEPAVHAVLTFLENDPLGQLDLPDDFDRGATIVFEVDGQRPTEQRRVREFWAAEYDPGAKGARTMQCIVCGQERPVLPVMEAKLKGVPGGQTAGTSIISANAEAFESYGLENSLIAPTCADCGEAFTNGANTLLSGREHRITLGGAAFIWWTREQVEFDLGAWFDDPKPVEVRELISSVVTGHARPEVDAVAFYATALSGSGGRTVVRDWIDTTIGEVKRELAQWFAAQEIVGEYGEAPRPLGLYALAAATVRDPKKELAPPTTRALLHAALTGTPLPMDLAARAVRRNVADGGVNRQRAALIKAVLSRHLNLAEGEMVKLDPARPEESYHLGRLLAVLAEIQRQALGDVNATIVDRFYGTASSAPGSVFQRLLGGARHHLAKLRHERPGAHVRLERQLEEIVGRVEKFPRVLVLPQQALFSLGFYHQRAHDRAEAMAGAVRRRAAQTDGASANSAVTPDDGAGARGDDAASEE